MRKYVCLAVFLSIVSLAAAADFTYTLDPEGKVVKTTLASSLELESYANGLQEEIGRLNTERTELLLKADAIQNQIDGLSKELEELEAAK